MTKTNRNEVDRLGDVRAEIAALEKEAEDLRNRIIATGRKQIEGDDYTATIKTGERRSLDTKAAIAWFGEEALERFMRQTETITVFTKAKK